VLTLAACVAGVSPLSLDVHYTADAPRAPGVELLSGLRVGVARFADERPGRGDDLHAASYVAEDAEYHVALSWGGRTFAPVARVVQGLLLRELRRAGFNADGIDAVLPPGGDRAARAAGERDHFDVVMTGRITELHAGDPSSISLDVVLYEVEGGTRLYGATFAERFAGATDSPQVRVDDLLERGFKPAAHQLIARLGEQLATYLAAATRAEEAAASAPPAIEPAAPSPAPAALPAHRKHHK